MLSDPFIVTETGTGEKFIQTGAETGNTVLGLPNPMSQQDIERLHLDRYREDYFALHGRFPFRSALEGSNPPDFVVTSANGDVWGLDCAVFADPSRRMAADMMRIFRKKLRLTAGKRDFSRIRGCQVSVHFSKSMDALPPRPKDRDAVIESLLDAMATCPYEREAWIRLNAEIAWNPDRMIGSWPKSDYSLDNGAGFYVNLRYSDDESRYLPMGFEVRLNMQSTDSVSGLFARLNKLVTDHDKAGIQHLLITAGGPDQHARCYSEENMTVRFLLDEHSDLQPEAKGLKAKHLRRVTIHSWGSKTIVDLPLTRVSHT